MIAVLTLAILSQAGQPIGGGQNISEQIACAPVSVAAEPTPSIRVVGGAAHGRIMFATGEPLVINGGSAQGLKSGQQYFVRRYVKDRFTPSSAEFIPHSVHTTGWITLTDVKESMSVATVTHACDGVILGDYLEAFVEPAVPATSEEAMPDFEHPGRVVMADERRQMGYPGLMMFISRGSDNGARPGQAVTIYRETMNGQGPTQMIGEATIVSVLAKTSLVRIESSHDAILLGDLAAIHRISQ